MVILTPDAFGDQCGECARVGRKPSPPAKGTVVTQERSPQTEMQPFGTTGAGLRTPGFLPSGEEGQKEPQAPIL